MIAAPPNSNARARRTEAFYRAVTYLSVAQPHLRDNVLLTRPLTAADVKDRPAGHWGTVPGAAWALAHALAAAAAMPCTTVRPMLGAGHAGVVQLAAAWLTGDLAALRPSYGRDTAGLTRLCRDFPDVSGLGAEVHPDLPAGEYLGGWLGGALPFAQGYALATPDEVVVPVIGDGECETPTTAASWLAHRSLPDARVLPVVHVNGFRMGSRSLLGAMADEEIVRYAAGLGWRARVFHIHDAGLADHIEYARVMDDALAAVIAGTPTAVFLRCLKGWGGPTTLGALQLLGTERLHKTPLTDASTDPKQRAALEAWARSYRPDELFTSCGEPIGALADALALAAPPAQHPAAAGLPPVPAAVIDAGWETFGDAVSTVLRAHAAAGDFRVFSPDELASNRLGGLAREPWATELLAEEVLFQWLAGWAAAGRRGVLISYEAFAPLLTTAILAHLKQRRMRHDGSARPSINLLLTSYGWQNTFTHGDPSLVTALLAAGDPAVRVLTPADPYRLAGVLHDALSSTGAVNVIIAGKHAIAALPRATARDERDAGLAIWPHLSDGGVPDLCVVVAGDLPAAVVTDAAEAVRDRHGARLRVVCLSDLTVLGAPDRWPAGLSAAQTEFYLGENCPVLIVTLGHPAAVWGLLAGRHRRPVEVIGWTEPHGPGPQAPLAASQGMSIDGVLAAAGRLLTQTPVPL